MARPRKVKEPAPLAFRLPAALVTAVDALVVRLNAENPHGPRWSRADIVRECLAVGVKRWSGDGLPPWAETPAADPARAA